MKFLILLAMILGFSSWSSAELCSADKALARLHFNIHSPREFKSLIKTVFGEMKANPKDFVLDMRSRMQLDDNRSAEVISYDRLSTPQPVMFGDIFVLVDLKTGEYSELRWFDKNLKHVVYNSKFQNCAINFIPMAVNTLF